MKLHFISIIIQYQIYIFFRTFEALNSTCFLRKDFNYTTFCNGHDDDYADLQTFVEKFKPEYVDNPSESDTLGKLLDISYGYVFAHSNKQKNSYHHTYEQFNRNILFNRSSDENSLEKFHSEIGRYQMYSKNSKTVDKLVYDMATQPLYRIGKVLKK